MASRSSRCRPATRAASASGSGSRRAATRRPRRSRKPAIARLRRDRRRRAGRHRGAWRWLDARDAARRCALEVAQAPGRRASPRWRRRKARDAELADELREAQAKVALLEARLAESQAQQAALEALYRDLAPSRDEIAITEVEQVLLLASQQLALAGNVPAALAALQLADAKLAAPRPAAIRAAAPRAGARHGPPEGGALRRRRRHVR